MNKVLNENILSFFAFWYYFYKYKKLKYQEEI